LFVRFTTPFIGLLMELHAKPLGNVIRGPMEDYKKPL